MPTTIRVRSLPELLTILPYQLGFRPSTCVVLAGIGDRLGPIARVDLPPRGYEGQVADTLLHPVLRHAHDGLLLVGYDEAPDASRPLLRVLRRRLRLMGYRDVETVVVRGGRWRRYAATSQAGPWAPLPQECDVPAVAEYVARERAPVVSRDQLAAVIAPEPAPDSALGEALLDAGTERAQLPLDQRRERRQVELDAWFHWRVGAMLEPTVRQQDDLVLLVTSLLDVQLRDAVIAWLCPGWLQVAALGPELAEDVRARLIHVVPDEDTPEADLLADILTTRVGAALEALCRATPLPFTVPLLTMTGMYRWWHGDGARARVALEAALVEEPGYRLADLVLRLVDAGIPPGECA